MVKHFLYDMELLDLDCPTLELYNPSYHGNANIGKKLLHSFYALLLMKYNIKIIHLILYQR